MKRIVHVKAGRGYEFPHLTKKEKKQELIFASLETEGTTSEEVLRALIDRFKILATEPPTADQNLNEFLSNENRVIAGILNDALEKQMFVIDLIKSHRKHHASEYPKD